MDIKTALSASTAFIEKLEEVAQDIAVVFPPAAGVASAITLGGKIATGILNEVPLAIQTYADIKVAVSGGAPVNADQWTAWEAAIEQAHSEFLAAAKAVEDGPG